MSGKGLQDLELHDEVMPSGADQDLGNLPDFGSFAPPPQPGAYRFMLPANMENVYELFDANVPDGKGGMKLEPRLRLIFDKDAPLTIVSSPFNKHNGETFHTRISNAERKRGQVTASDADYLLKALGVKTRPAGNKSFAELVKTLGGKVFGADITYSWYCDAKRDIYVFSQAKGKSVKVEGTKGCGAKYYQHDKTKKAEQQIQKLADGTYPYELTCTCGAAIRAFGNLDNIRA